MTEYGEYNPLDPRTHVGAFVNDYAQTGNPLNAWSAYDAARRLHQPIPDLVLQYFDRVAERLLKLGSGPILAIEHDRQLRAMERERKAGLYDNYKRPDYAMRGPDHDPTESRRRLPRPPRDPAPAIAKAMEMDRKGRGSVFERLRRVAIEEHLAWEVADRVISEGQKPDQALNAAAEDFGVSRETARRAWKKHSARALADIRRVKELSARHGLDERMTEEEARARLMKPFTRPPIEDAE